MVSSFLLSPISSQTEENLRLRIVNEYVKKLSALDQEDQKK